MKCLNTRTCLWVAFAALISLCSQNVISSPQMSRIEPLPSHSVFGIDQHSPATEARHKGSWMASIHLTPFYQDAQGARDENGNKVAVGAEYGAWNTAGIFYGVEKANVSDLYYVANPLPNSTWAGAKVVTSTENYKNFKAALELLDLKHTKTDDSTFVVTNKTEGFDTVEIEYKRLGVRGEIRVAPFEGFDATLRGGACEYVMTPTTLTPLTTPDDTDTLLSKLQNTHNRREIMSELGLSIDRVEETIFEDTYARVSAGYPFIFNDREGRAVLNCVPSIAGGAWLPTGKKLDHDKPFSIDGGNDGHIGYAVEGALNLDFIDTVALSFGGGVTFFNDKTFDKFRVPNHRLQNGFYPWTTKVKRDPGYSYFGHISMRSINFIPNTTAYFDYSYQAHKADTLTCQDADAARAKLFAEGVKMLSERSAWNSWTMSLGIIYEATQNLEMGLGLNAHAKGKNVFRTNTVMGSVRFLF